jgi:hypothetical protein
MNEPTRAEIEAGFEALMERHLAEYGRAFPWVKGGSSWGYEVRVMVRTVLAAAARARCLRPEDV